jgi:DNA polymerase (family 10)
VTPQEPLSRTLRILADLAEIRGDSTEAADLRRAAAAIGVMEPGAAADFQRRARHPHFVSGLGLSPAVDWQLREIALGDAGGAVSSAQARLPWMLRRLLELPALSSDQAATLVRQLGIVTVADLQAALDDGRVRQIAGEAVDLQLQQALAALDPEGRSISLGRAWDTLEAVLADIGGACPTIDLLTAAGDIRRFEPLVSSIVIVGRASDPPDAVDALCAMPGVDEVLHRSGRRAILLTDRSEIDVRVAAPDEYGTVLFTATGSRAHVHAIRQRRARPALAAREEEVYGQAGLPFIPAELRHGSGEIEAAAAGALPALVSREDIRGDLHMHTTYSDGADTLDAMVAACCALGYEYIAITDHSERAAAARTLGPADLARQTDEIAAIRARYPQLVILHGVEVDIMPDGRLDFSDAALEPLDIVLASLHDAAQHDARTLTRRCIQAIRHPLVTIITHPANRIVGRRAGYSLDFDAIYAAAAETGTALEVDGAPAHMDLDGEHARAAVAAGATLAIDSDCHRARWLDRQMLMGIGTARRGWAEPRHVLNARPLAEVRAFIAAKRALR